MPPAARISERDSLAAKIDPIFARYTSETPGCAVGVYRAGNIVFERGYGMADLEHGAALAPNSVFYLASVSKQFTAAAILLLVQDGKLSLDHSVRKYIPELHESTAPVTLRHMLQHTSGLRDYLDLLGLDGVEPSDIATDFDGLWALSHQKALNFAPGTAWSYSNSGYFLASLIVKRVTGETLAAFSKRRMFEPLGMTHTQFRDDHTLLVPNRAVGYERSVSGKFGTASSGLEATGDGGLLSSIDDLAKWDANFFEPKIGGPKMLETMRTPGKLSNGTATHYGMGLGFRTVGGIPVESHGGGFSGYRTYFERVPSERLSVAVLCNDGSTPARELAAEVRAAVDPKLRGPEPKDTTVAGTPPLDVFKGNYIDRATLDVRQFEVQDGSLVFRSGEAGEKPVVVLPVGARSFRATTGTAHYEFEGNGESRPIRVRRFATDEGAQTYERFAEPFKPNAAALEAYAGRYTSDEKRHDIVIQHVDGALFFGIWGRRPADKLRPVIEGGFRLGGLALFFERDRSGKVTGLRLRDERVRDLRLKRQSR